MPPGTDRRAAPRADAARDRAARFDFFFYGTLCDADVRKVVFGRAVEAVPATLADHEAVPVVRGRFPMLMFQRGRTAAGVLCRGLTLADAARLGFYEHEGRDYGVRILAVSHAGGLHRAWTYVPLAALRRGMGRWDLAEWQRFAKRDFLARAARWMRRVEAKDLEPFVDLWRGRA
ncbi:MAG: gamma-glutamylcyclotransferase family protein [Alphaproteobacteria bacterium]